MSSLVQQNQNCTKNLNFRIFVKNWTFFLVLLEKAASWFFLLMIEVYRIVLSPVLGGACRFEPSCSQYSIEAFKKHSLKNALILSIRRILSCRPGGKFGYDPVPKNLTEECGCVHGKK